MNQLTLRQSAAVFADYDSIYAALRRYGVDPLGLNIFPKVLGHLKNTHKLDVIETIVYANFDDIPGRSQTCLRRLGLTTRHCPERSHVELNLAINTVIMLMENPHIDVFVIISASNSVIELINTIRYKNKSAFCITLREDTDSSLPGCSDWHEYLDDIIGVPPPGAWRVDFNRKDLAFDEVRRARKVARLFYDSNIWKKYEATGQPVSLTGYLAALSKALNEDIPQLRKAFEIAHFLKYVAIYSINDVLYIRRGSRYKKVTK